MYHDPIRGDSKLFQQNKGVIVTTNKTNFYIRNLIW